MKILLSFLLVFSSLTLLAQNPIDGKWKGSRETPNGPMEFTYTFKVEGKELKGNIVTQFGELPLENGKADGKKFTYSISFNGNSMSSEGELTATDEITIKNERGEMKLTRVKE